jgi:hypothetical protein
VRSAEHSLPPADLDANLSLPARQGGEVPLYSTEQVWAPPVASGDRHGKCLRQALPGNGRKPTHGCLNVRFDIQLPHHQPYEAGRPDERACPGECVTERFSPPFDRRTLEANQRDVRAAPETDTWRHYTG